MKQHIEELFKTTDKFCDTDKKLYINTILEAIENIDSELIKILINDNVAKKHFFTSVEGIFVLNQIKLIEFFTINNHFEDSYTSYTNKIGLIKKDSFIKKFDDVVLAFPHKDCILEGGQTKDDDKSKENFFNEIVNSDDIDRLEEPKVLTNIKRYTKDGIEENPTIKDDDNLIIKGNNLLALYSLRERYNGKVKLIYIDPPYNTGSDSFGYNDNFNHSTWLTFMKNRLEVAKEFLSDDGVIFVQCDDNEQAYLKVLMDEVFNGRFVKTLHIQMSIVQGEKVKAAKQGNIVKNGEYIHIYSKDGNKKIGLTPLYEPSNYDTHYSIFIDENFNEIPLIEFCIKDKKIYQLLELAGLIKKDKLTNLNLARAYNEIPTFKDFIHNHSNNIVRTHTMIEVDKSKLEINLVQKKTYIYKHKDREYLYGIDTKGKLKQRIRLSDKLKKCDDYYNSYQTSNMRGDWWSGYHIDMGNINKECNVTLDNGQKPERLLENILKLVTRENDLIMDFHLGSGTTCAVAHKMGRKYIGIEQMDYIKDLPIKRLSDITKSDISGSFIYAELKEIDSFKDKELGALNHNMQYLPIGDIEDEDYDISKEEIDINKKFYGIDE